MKILSIFGTLMTLVIFAETKPAVPYHHEIYYSHPLPIAVSHASSQTTVIRDVLGNQGTAYAYQHHDGLSSSVVAVSRSDNSKTLAFVPPVAAAPVIAPQPVVYAHHHYQPTISVASGGGVPVPVGYSNYYGR